MQSALSFHCVAGTRVCWQEVLACFHPGHKVFFLHCQSLKPVDDSA